MSLAARERRSGAVVVAPLRREIAPFLSTIHAKSHVKADGLDVARGDLGGLEVFAAVIGEGVSSGHNVARLSSLIAPDRLLLIGFAGALSEDLDAGTLMQAEEIFRAGADDGLSPSGPRLDTLPGGPIYSSPAILSAARSKQELWMQVGRPPRAVVDLESWSVAQAACAAGLAWSVIRAVSDTANETLPLDFAALGDETGRVSPGRVVSAALRRPSVLPALVRLRSRTRAAATALSEAACRWILE